jgi:hypothetical protein
MHDPGGPPIDTFAASSIIGHQIIQTSTTIMPHLIRIFAFLALLFVSVSASSPAKPASVVSNLSPKNSLKETAPL